MTDRTIRSDVEAVNRQSGGLGIESSVRRGYRAIRRQEQREQGPEGPLASDIPQTPGARCIYMIQRLLFENRELNLTQLQSQIYVSDYSLQND